MKSLDGRVAVVNDGGDEVGRAIALALAARGVRVVVMGRHETSLGETVGEIAYGGGKARHVVGDLAAAIARAREVFGALDIVVSSGTAPPELTAQWISCDAVAADAGVGAEPEQIAERVVSLCS